MNRQIIRTIRSLSPSMQRGVAADDYEIVVVDNGSSEPTDRVACERFGAQVRWLRLDEGGPSPARAMNWGISQARAPLVGAMIDGARLASPGLLHGAELAARLDARPLVLTHGFHLGSQLQQRAVAMGYGEEAEAELLAGVDWVRDGYRLFDVSVVGASSRNGWFALPFESNAVFMPAAMWGELGGYDEAFTSPGGGLVNLDLLVRACALDSTQAILLLGEATFHQFHGGFTTNSAKSRWADQQAEYMRLRGTPFKAPELEPLLFGIRPPTLSRE